MLLWLISLFSNQATIRVIGEVSSSVITLMRFCLIILIDNVIDAGPYKENSAIKNKNSIILIERKTDYTQ